MNKQIKITFCLLVLFQGLHSIEEYIGRLWEVFLPAKIISSLISSNHEKGFIIFNICLFIFGLWTWLFPVRKNKLLAVGLLWFWTTIEMINGIGHPLWALYNRSYVPGLATAPILLVLAIYLFKQLLQVDPKLLSK